MTENSLYKPLIKYSRLDGDKVILVPTADGVKYFEQFKPTFVAERTGQQKVFTEEQDRIGDTQLLAFTARFDNRIVHFDHGQNPAMNFNTFRCFIGGGLDTNWLLRIPWSLKGLDIKKEGCLNIFRY
jgi:hypothetical protein